MVLNGVARYRSYKAGACKKKHFFRLKSIFCMSSDKKKLGIQIAGAILKRIKISLIFGNTLKKKDFIFLKLNLCIHKIYTKITIYIRYVFFWYTVGIILYT